MTNRRIQLHRVIAGPQGLSKALELFAKDPNGIITAFDDALIPTVRNLLGEDSSVEIKFFGEVVRQTLILADDPPLPIYKSGYVEAAIASVCEDLPFGSPFEPTKRHPGLHDALADTLSNLHEWGLDAEGMNRVALMSTRRLADKLNSLAEIDREVKQTLQSLGREGLSDQLMRFTHDNVAQLEGDYDRMLIVIGSDISPMRLNFIRWIAHQGCQVTLVGERHPNNSQMFAEMNVVASELAVEPMDVGASSDLQARLFGDPEAGGAHVDVVLQFAADPLAETEWALREARDSHGVIFVRDVPGYAPLIESAAKRLNVPVKIARRVPLLTNAFARVTMAAVEFCISDNVRTLELLVHSSYLKLTGIQQELLRSGLKDARRTRDAQWRTLQDFAESHAESFPWLLFLLDWRSRTITTTQSVREWHALFTELLTTEELPWSQNVADGDVHMLNRDIYARNRMQMVLGQYVSIESVRADRGISFREFVRWLKPYLKKADVAIPQSGDGILVTGSTSALVTFERVIVLGMLEGVFPRRRSENPILTDDELAELSRRLPECFPLPDSHVRAARERDEFYRVCSAAQSRLVLSYPLTSDDRDNVPAFYLHEVQRVMGLPDPKEIERTRLYPDDPIIDADILLKSALESEPEMPNYAAVSTFDAGLAIAHDPSQGVTVNELKDAFRCPFMYVARHRLRLRPRRSNERWGNLRRLPAEAMLALPSTEEETRLRLQIALDSKIEQLYSEVPEWELRLLQSGGMRIVREWIDREFRARELWPKERNSVLLNVGFGTHGLRDEITSTVRLVGTVPATSRFGPYSVAHIYGSMPSEPSKIGEIETLELGAYMLAQFQKGQETAVEIDGTGSTRTLFILNRIGNVVSDSQRMKIVDLGQDADPVQAKREFFDAAKRFIGESARVISRGTMEVKPGDYCERCDFGELCRRSRVFGEDDSPFGPDLETNDGI